MVAALGMLGISAATGLLKALQHSRSSEKTSQATALDKIASFGADGQDMPVKGAKSANSAGQDVSALPPPPPPPADASTMASILQAQEQAGSRLFQKLNTDGDATISKDELTAALSKLDASGKKTEGAEEAASKAQSFADKLLAQLDTNKDGSISRDELTEALRSRHGKGHKPMPLPGEDPAATPATGDTTAAASTGATQPAGGVSQADLNNAVNAYGRAPSGLLMGLLKTADTSVAA